MELFELKYVKVLAECCNFSRASEKLFITQSALSQQIHKLENEIGFELFYRSSRQVSLTENGQRFLEQAEKTLKEYSKLEQTVQNINNQAQKKITFGASQFISPSISQIIPQFLKKHPDIDFQLIEMTNPDLLARVKANQVDIGIIPLISDSDPKGQLQIFPIRRENVFAIVYKDHPLAGYETVTLRDLTDYQLIFSSMRTGLKNVIFNELEKQGLKVREPFDITSRNARIPFLTGGAVTFSLSVMNEWEELDDFVRIPIEPGIYSDISLILPKGKYITPALKDLIELIADAMKTQS